MVSCRGPLKIQGPRRVCVCVCVCQSEVCVCQSEVCVCQSEVCVCVCQSEVCVWQSEVRACVVISVWTVFRIQDCSQEMVVIREDLVNKMCRNCLTPEQQPGH